jgi:hypothetical protein
MHPTPHTGLVVASRPLPQSSVLLAGGAGNQAINLPQKHSSRPTPLHSDGESFDSDKLSPLSGEPEFVSEVVSVLILPTTALPVGIDIWFLEAAGLGPDPQLSSLSSTSWPRRGPGVITKRWEVLLDY